MDIKKTSEAFLQKIKTIKDLDSLERLRVEYIGRKGVINLFIEKMKELSIDEKKEMGIKINNFKNLITTEINSITNKLLKENEENENIDISLPGNKYPKGSLHPTTTAIYEITKIFQKIGFVKSHYPEVEREFFAFDALNMPKSHPARDDFETFFLEAPESKELGKLILTPHTSSSQIREMQRLGKPPIRMISIGKCYRPNWDTVHTPMFHQFEGMCIDKDISIVNLKGTIDYFVNEFFGNDRKTRLRPYHFQFTEPSFEVDISCGICNGTGIIKSKQETCKVCKSGWLELGGAGMIHQNVLKQGGINPEKFTGWAFGFGIERVFMMKEGLMLDDIRILYSGNLEFLRQF